MIVSLLQLMGFPRALPVHSRAEETLPDKDKQLENKGRAAAPTDQPQDSSARRHEVKASSGKDNKVKITTPVAKTPVKAVVKPVVKPAAVQAAPKATKPVAKAVLKPVAKPAAKPVVKAPLPAPKAKPAAGSEAKSVTKATSAAKKSVAKPVSKLAAKPVIALPVSVEKSPMPVTPSPAKVPAAPSVTSVATPPAKAGRPSSRLAQLTVPSMAQAVASTAAKASYSQSTPLPVIVPVLPSAVKKDPKLANNWKTKAVAELSDAELMAMPDSEYMNEVQMSAFRLKLVTLKRDILSNAGETTEHLREDTSVTPDPADRATIEEEHALELRTRDRERKLLKKIEQSIARIDAGDYGYCDETGEPIGVGRLLARPTATLSLEAQQRRELKQKMFGD
jgi:DnaK suppressor protein